MKKIFLFYLVFSTILFTTCVPILSTYSSSPITTTGPIFTNGRIFIDLNGGVDTKPYQFNFHPNGKILATINLGKIKIWDLEKEKIIYEPDPNPQLKHYNTASDIIFVNNGQNLLAYGAYHPDDLDFTEHFNKPRKDLRVGYRIFETSKFTPQNKFPFHVKLPVIKKLFDQNHNRLIILGGGYAAAPIKLFIYDTNTWKLEKSVMTTAEGISGALAFTKDSQFFAFNHFDYKRWDQSGKKWGKVFIDQKPEDPFHNIQIWQTKPLKMVGEIKGAKNDYINSLAFHPNGKLLASAGWIKNYISFNPPIRESIDIWDIKKMKLLKKMPFIHTANIVMLSFSTDGKTLYSFGCDGFLIAWDWEKGKILDKYKSNVNDTVFLNGAINAQKNRIVIGTPRKFIVFDLKNNQGDYL